MPKKCIISFALSVLCTFGFSQTSSPFSVPIWHPDAKWEVVRLGGSNARGFLQGPVAEMGYNALAAPAADWGGGMGHGYVNADGGITLFGWYDENNGRAHSIVGNGIGYLDGPFESARFCASGYNFKPNCALSQDGRYLFITDMWGSRRMLRVLDFKEQQVKTIIPVITSESNPGLTCGYNGKIYMLAAQSNLIGTVFKTSCTLTILSDSGVVESVRKLDSLNGKLGGINRLLPIAYDNVHNRLYCGQSSTDWYVHYWDLSDGSVHGVVPKTPIRERNAPGSFDGVSFYNEGAFLTFGPDDPDKRFLYMGHIDTYQCHRLDLQNRMVAALLEISGNPSTVKFSDSAQSNVKVYGSFKWVNNGHDFTSGSHSPVQNYLFKRIN